MCLGASNLSISACVKACCAILPVDVEDEFVEGEEEEEDTESSLADARLGVDDESQGTLCERMASGEGWCVVLSDSSVCNQSRALDQGGNKSRLMISQYSLAMDVKSLSISFRVYDCCTGPSAIRAGE